MLQDWANVMQSIGLSTATRKDQLILNERAVMQLIAAGFESMHLQHETHSI